MMTLALADRQLCYNPPSPENSMLYTFLPSMVKSRLPVLTSVRRSLKMATSRKSATLHSRIHSESSLDGLSSPTNIFTNINHEAMVRDQLWQVVPRSRDASPEARDSTTSSSSSSTPPTSSGALAAPAALSLDRALRCPIHETSTGVEWDTAVTALLLLSKACHRAQQPGARPENTRALVVDANKWLLRSLPDHLDERELEEIDEVLPTGLLDDPVRISRRRERPDSRPSLQENRSWLRRLVAFGILQVSLLIAIVIPYLIALANACYRLERQNHITERFLTGGIDITNLVGESGIELKDAILRLGEGRLANSVVQTGAWLIDSVVGGFSDGAGVGVAIVGEAMLSREPQQKKPGIESACTPASDRQA